MTPVPWFASALVAPPAGKGTTILTGLLGQSVVCANVFVMSKEANKLKNLFISFFPYPL
jgi:hypothetical protein